MHQLASIASLQRKLPEHVKASPANFLEWAEEALKIVRMLPPEAQMRGLSLIDLRIDDPTFRQIFAGCEVHESKMERWVFCGNIQILCWRDEFEPDPPAPQKWTRKLSAVDATV